MRDGNRFSHQAAFRGGCCLPQTFADGADTELTRPVAGVLTNLVAITALVGVAFPLGFSPAAGLLDWLGVIAVVGYVWASASFKKRA